MNKLQKLTFQFQNKEITKEQYLKELEKLKKLNNKTLFTKNL